MQFYPRVFGDGLVCSQFPIKFLPIFAEKNVEFSIIFCNSILSDLPESTS